MTLNELELLAAAEVTQGCRFLVVEAADVLDAIRNFRASMANAINDNDTDKLREMAGMPPKWKRTAIHAGDCAAWEEVVDESG